MQKQIEIPQLKSRLRERLSGSPAALAYLYGSCASGASTEKSDIDIALVYKDKITPREALKIELNLELQNYLKNLQTLEKLGKKDFLSDFRNIESANNLIQASIGCCLDISNHIIASEKMRSPNDYADSFRFLHENKIIPDDLLNNLIEMAKFRNRLVHLYWEFDEEMIFEIIQSNLSDFIVSSNRYLISSACLKAHLN